MSYALGLLFIVLVSLIWAAASVLVQSLYQKASFDSPFLLTYIGSSLFILLLPLEHRRCRSNGPYRALRSTETARGARAPCERCDSDHISLVRTRDSEQSRPVASSSPHDASVSSSVPSDALLDGAAEPDPPFTIATSALPSPDTPDTPAQEPIPSAAAAVVSDATGCWTVRDHLRAALRIAPVWFVSNWSYNASLKFTTITSSTVLASTGSLFTFGFAVLFGDESYTLVKLMGVLFGMAGSIVTGLHDATEGTDVNDDSVNATAAFSATDSLTETAALFDSNDADSNDSSNNGALLLYGDFLGLLSAVGYGSYAVMVRLLLPHDESKMSMPLFLGFVGLCNFLLLLPFCVYQLVFLELLRELSWIVFGCLIVKGILDNVLSDYLWARAVVLTDATVATVGLGLTIPLAFLSDWVFDDIPMQWPSVVGAVSVLAGFILVNIGAVRQTQVEESDGELQQQRQRQQPVDPSYKDNPSTTTTTTTVV